MKDSNVTSEFSENSELFGCIESSCYAILGLFANDMLIWHNNY